MMISDRREPKAAGIPRLSSGLLDVSLDLVFDSGGMEGEGRG